MRIPTDTLRGWLIPAVLVAAATLLTVPWTYWVIKAAYDRDVLDNAQSLARRVELRVLRWPRTDSTRAEAAAALKPELVSDPTVQLAVYYDLTADPPFPVGWTREEGEGEARFTLPPGEILHRATSGTLVDQFGDSYVISIPWVKEGSVVGFTYLELSRAALAEEFWKKEGSLITRVVGLTAAVIAFLSAVGLYAYGARQKVGYVQERAELARQGLLAERGLTAAVLAHEIRNPLAALRFQLHSLRKNAGEIDRVETTADTIDAELSRIQQLVTDYLEHERATHMGVARVDLEGAARALQRLMLELFQETRTELEVIPPPAPVEVICDPHALRQVLMNLLLNAREAMGQRGKVTLQIRRDEAFGVIDVRDTGPGIPAEMRDQLFKPFQTSKADGHGIGLALVKRFVDNFGGGVSVDSEPGKGTTFHLRLPLAEGSGFGVQGSGRERSEPIANATYTSVPEP